MNGGLIGVGVGVPVERVDDRLSLDERIDLGSLGKDICVDGHVSLHGIREWLLTL